MVKPAKQGRNDVCACGSGKKFKQCCMLKPANASVPSSLQALDMAIAHFERGNHQSAIVICQRILQGEPANFSAMTLLGVLAFYAGNADAAVHLLEKSLAIQPTQPDAHNNLGEILRATGQFQSALRHFQEALQINPRHLGALINCGNALQDVYRYQDAIEAYQAALTVMPTHAGALSNLANIYQQLYRHQDAIATFSRLLQVAPDYDWALGGRMYSRIHCCDWQDYEQDVAEITRQVSQGKRAIKVFELRPISGDPALELLCARTFADAMYPVGPVVKNAGIDTLENAQELANRVIKSQSRTEKIKIAYLSADFREHPVSQLLVGVIEQHDRAVFEVIGISFGPDDGSASRVRMMSAFDVFIDVRDQSDEQVAQLLRTMNVDIAIDLMGYTTHARPAIFTQRAAPVQVSYLGYAGTTGSVAMDYIIADDVIIPVQYEQYYAERVIRLPGPLLPRDTSLADASVPTRLEAGLPEKAFVFCAFNNHYKISPAIFDVWMRLLGRLEGSVLWLSAANPVVQDNLRSEAAKRGIAPGRIIFARRTERLEDHLARHALADLFLDTFPYNAHTTASDALWASLPVVSMLGETFAARVAGSLLHALTMPELVTESLDAYEQLAYGLAADRSRLEAVKARLLHNKTALAVFDVKQYTRNLEQALTQLVPPVEGKAIA